MTGEPSSLEPADGTAPRVLIVDDDAVVRDAIGMVLSDEGYDCQTTVAAPRPRSTLVREADPHLVISDMKMPGKDGLWLLDRLRRERPDTAVVMLTAYGDTEAAVECLRRGATDYLLKPPKVDRPAPGHRARPLPAAGRAGPRALPDAACSARSGRRPPTCAAPSSRWRPPTTAPSTRWWPPSTPGSTRPATTPSGWGATRWPSPTAWACPMDERHDIFRGALLHDIGKIGVPDAILLKPGPLDAAEWEEMRKHPQTGFNILKSIGFLRVPAEIVLSHQERFDGSGYPRGLRGEAHPGGGAHLRRRRRARRHDERPALPEEPRASPRAIARDRPRSRGPSSTPTVRRGAPRHRPGRHRDHRAPGDPPPVTDGVATPGSRAAARRPPGAAHRLPAPLPHRPLQLPLQLLQPGARDRARGRPRPRRHPAARGGSSPRWASGASGSPEASRPCAGTSSRSSPTSTPRPGIEEVALTTNGHRLEELAVPLRQAGLRQLNVSLDTFDGERLERLSGRAADVERIRRGIAAAASAGYPSLKVNTVVLRDVNYGELGDLARFAWRHGAIARYIELMPFGGGDAGLGGRDAARCSSSRGSGSSPTPPGAGARPATCAARRSTTGGRSTGCSASSAPSPRTSARTATGSG